jgi:hypothetical protein
MNAQPVATPVADRAVAGRTAAAQWAQLQTAAPQAVATVQRYLRRLAVFQAPRSVDVAENSLRQFVWWLTAETGSDSIAAVGRDRRPDPEADWARVAGLGVRWGGG